LAQEKKYRTILQRLERKTQKRDRRGGKAGPRKTAYLK